MKKVVEMLSKLSVQNILSIMIPGTFILEIVTYKWWGPSAGDALRMIDGLLGLHGGWAAMVIGYHFNSSASSARKDEIIASSAPVGEGQVRPPPLNAPDVPAAPVTPAAPTWRTSAADLRTAPPIPPR